MGMRLLTDEQINAVVEEVRAQAEKLGEEPRRFTVEAVAQRLEQRYGVKYSRTTVWRRAVNNGWKFHRSPHTYEPRGAAHEEELKARTEGRTRGN